MKKILVTGASGGIGSQTAVAFAKCGCDVALHYSKNSEKAESLAEKLTNEYGIYTFTVQADVSDYESVCKMFDEIDSRFGNLDVLVNNAGIAQQKLFTDITPDEWKKMTGRQRGRRVLLHPRSPPPYAAAAVRLHPQRQFHVGTGRCVL